MAKKATVGRGYVGGVFGRNRGALIWISGFVSAREYQTAKRRLEEVYVLVYGHRPKRVTKTDVVQFALLQTNPGSSAFDRLVALKVAAVDG